MSLVSSVGATLDCSRCTLQSNMFKYTHNWCAVDQRCYGINSRLNPCGPTECVSHSALSRCAARCPPTRPSQLRLALAGHDSQGWPTGVSITWFTYESGDRNVVELWDQHPHHLHRTQWVARSSEYCPPFGQHHTATLSGLEDGRVYQYRVGGDVWSEWQTFRFRTGANGRPYRLHVFGDHGYSNSTARPMQISVGPYLAKTWSATFTYDQMRRLVDTDSVDGIWHLGDIGYADTSFAHSLGSFTYEDT